MSDAAYTSLLQALELTAEMIEAATCENWSQVVTLDVQRQNCLKQAPIEVLKPAHREALKALQSHNQALLDRTVMAHASLEKQLGQHQYNHRALQTYISSASTR